MQKLYSEIAVIIMIGGKSSRLGGGIKSLIKINNKKIFDIILERIQPQIDKISGYMFLNNINPENKIFYTTGRLTSEMIIKTVKMKIPILISRSGFTSWGVEIAKKTNLTLIGRAKGKRYTILSGHKRLKH